ncbi:MAG: T9SS type A sorting domain-containing protein [Bacteroidota bacterium]
MKKTVLQIMLMMVTISLTSQSYQFGIVSDYYATGNPFEFTFVATPDFDNANPNMADIQLSLAITTGNSIQANSFTALLGSGWQINTALTGTTLQGFGIGDGSKDIWVFTLPVPTSALTTPHTTDIGIPVFSFIVDNTPTSGMIAILENDDPIATALAGLGFVVDNVINADLGDGSGTQDYYGHTDSANNAFLFASLSVNDVLETTLEMSLYPNPAKDTVAILGDTSGINSVDIYTINGQLVKTIKTDFDKISIEALEASVYLLRLYGDNARYPTLRLVKH